MVCGGQHQRKGAQRQASAHLGCQRIPGVPRWAGPQAAGGRWAVAALVLQPCGRPSIVQCTCVMASFQRGCSSMVMCTD